MENYPSIPLYRGDEINALKRAANPSLSVALPNALWNIDSFRILPCGTKLLYGIIVSKLVNSEDLSIRSKPGCICFTERQIIDLLGCSQRTAHAYRNALASSGLIAKETSGKARGEGKGMHAVMYPQYSVDVTGAATILIPLSLFSCDDFIWLPV